MPSGKEFLKRRSVKLLIVVGVFLLLLPEAVRWGVVKGIEANGFGAASIDDVDINLFSGRVAVDEFTLHRDSQKKLAFEKLAVDISWLKLVVGIIYVEEFEFTGGRLAVVQLDDGNWEVVLPLEAEASAEPSSVANEEQSIELPRIAAAQLRLVDVEVAVDSQLTQGVLAVRELLLARLSTWQKESASVKMLATWNTAPLKLDITVSPWIETPTLQGKVKLDKVELNAILPGTEDAQSAAVSLDIDIDASRSQQGDINASVDGGFSVEQLAAAYNNIELAVEAFAWDGDITFSSSEDNTQYLVAGDLQSSELRITDNKQQLALLAWDTLSLEGLSLDEWINVDFSQLVLTSLGAFIDGKDEQGLLYTGELVIDELSLEEARSLVVNRIDIVDGNYDVTLNEDGTLAINQILANVLSNFSETEPPAHNTEEKAETGTGASESKSTDDTAGEFQIVLNELEVASGTQVSFTDKRFDVPVKQQLTIDTLSVNGLNQQQADSLTTLKLDGNLGEFSKVSINGSIKPFAEKLWAGISGELDSIDLTGVSPYTEAYIGYHMSRGQYDHQFELSIADDDIKLDNTLLLRKLSLKAVDPNKEQPVAKELSLPLPLALDMLRDGDDNISLNVPIKGRMDNPDVDVSGVINTALGQALKSGTTSYLKLALQPYGAAFMAAEFLGEKMSAITLDPVTFENGVSQLTSEQLGYTGKIASVLNQRPKLTLTLCARANVKDKVALQALQPDKPVEDAALVSLADERGKHIKRELVAKGIDNQRVLICQPAFEPDAAAEVTVKM